MNKSTLRQLFDQYNKAVKPRYIAENVDAFENYLKSYAQHDETLIDGVNYIEIASNETITGNPVVLNWD